MALIAAQLTMVECFELILQIKGIYGGSSRFLRDLDASPLPANVLIIVNNPAGSFCRMAFCSRGARALLSNFVGHGLSRARTGTWGLYLNKLLIHANWSHRSLLLLNSAKIWRLEPLFGRVSRVWRLVILAHCLVLILNWVVCDGRASASPIKNTLNCALIYLNLLLVDSLHQRLGHISGRRYQRSRNSKRSRILGILGLKLLWIPQSRRASPNHTSLHRHQIGDRWFVCIIACRCTHRGKSTSVQISTPILCRNLTLIFLSVCWRLREIWGEISSDTQRHHGRLLCAQLLIRNCG